MKNLVVIEKGRTGFARFTRLRIDGPPPRRLPGNAAAIVVATKTFLENGLMQIGPGARMPELRRMLA